MIRKKITLTDCFNEFIIEKEAEGMSKATLQNYAQSFKSLKTFLNSDEIKSITNQNIQLYSIFLKNSKIRVESVKHYMRECRAFVYWMQKNKYIDSFKIIIPKGQEESIKYFVTEEVEELIKKPSLDMPFTTWRNWAISITICATGLRCSSLCSLKVSDIDFDNRQISINTTKNKKPLVLPLSQSAVVYLKQYVRLFEISEWLFPTVDNQQLTPNGMQCSFRRYCKNKGLNRKNLHALRHYFAITATKQGMNPFVLKRTMGHASIETTMRYVNLANEDIRDSLQEYSPLESLTRKQRKMKRQ